MRSILRIRPVLLRIPCSNSQKGVKRTLTLTPIILDTSEPINPQESKPPNDTKSVVVMKNPGFENDPHVGHYERNFITATRAMQDFMLRPEHLVGLRATTRRSPVENSLHVKVYWRKDVEAKSLQVWGSAENMETEKEKSKLLEEDEKELVSFFKRLVKRKSDKRNEKKEYDRQNWPVRGIRNHEKGLDSDSGKVVTTAIAINSMNCFAKGIAWIYTGSHVMFSEMIHSGADTMNQVMLFI